MEENVVMHLSNKPDLFDNAEASNLKDSRKVTENQTSFVIEDKTVIDMKLCDKSENIVEEVPISDSSENVTANIQANPDAGAPTILQEESTADQNDDANICSKLINPVQFKATSIQDNKVASNEIRENALDRSVIIANNQLSGNESNVNESHIICEKEVSVDVCHDESILDLSKTTTNLMGIDNDKMQPEVNNEPEEFLCKIDNLDNNTSLGVEELTTKMQTSELNLLEVSKTIHEGKTVNVTEQSKNLLNFSMPCEVEPFVSQKSEDILG